VAGIATYTDLRCPQCGKTARVKNLVLKASRMHQCPKLRGMSAPMVREGVQCEVVLNEREDYIGDQKTRVVQLDPERQRPVMNMQVRYADGRTDTTVFAPAARMAARR
jgi:hypothetical protein